MKKLIILFTSVIVLLISFLILLNNFKNIEENEIIYSLNTNYAFLSDGNINIIFKVYSNQKSSLLKYAEEANVSLHDKNKENILAVDVEGVSITNVALYKNKEFFEYSLNTFIDITDIKIENCYMTLKFTNKEYLFCLGDFEVKKSNCLINKLAITNLYGLSSAEDISMAGIVISLKNSKDKPVEITEVKVGGGYEVQLYEKNIDIKESTKIEDYLNDDECVDSIRINSGQTKTFVIALEKETNCYLYNDYILFSVNEVMCYIENFNYINSNDLDSLQKYIKVGNIYAI